MRVRPWLARSVVVGLALIGLAPGLWPAARVNAGLLVWNHAASSLTNLKGDWLLHAPARAPLERAEARLQRTIAGAPPRDSVWVALGVAQAWSGRLVEARQTWGQVQDRRFIFAAGQGMEAAGQWEAAVQVYLEALTIDSAEPGLSNIYFQIAHLQHKRRQPPQLPAAQQAYLQAILYDDYPIDAWQRAASHRSLGDVYAELGNAPAAVDQYARALQLDPAYDVRLDYARALWAANRPNEAIQTLQQAIQNEPQRKLAYALLGEYYRERNETGKAINIYTQLLALDPTDDRVQRILQKLNEP